MPRSSHPVPRILAAVRIAVALAALFGSVRATPSAAQFIEPLNVIAQGVVELSAGPFAWRVREIAYPFSGESDAPGFVAPLLGSGFIVRTGAESAVAVGRGEAAFVAAGPRRIVAMSDGADGTALEFSLVESPGKDIGRTSVDLSESFSLVSPGSYDLNLLAVSIPAGETASLPYGSDPLLVMAVHGGVQAEPQGAPFERLAEGQFALVPPGGLLRADLGKPHDSSHVMVLSLNMLKTAPPDPMGSTLPPMADSSEPAAIKIRTRLCPPRTPEKGLTVACRREFGGVEFQLDGVTIDPGMTDDWGRLTLEGIAPGRHVLSDDGFFGAASTSASCRDDQGGVVSTDAATPGPYPDGARLVVDVAPGAEILCDWYLVIYDNRAAHGTASIEITMTRCPVGYEGMDLERDCTDPVDGLFLALDGPTAGSGTTSNGLIGFTRLYATSLYELTAGIDGYDRSMILDCRDASGTQMAAPIDQHTSGIAVPADGVVTCSAYALDTGLWWRFIEAPGALFP